MDEKVKWVLVLLVVSILSFIASGVSLWLTFPHATGITAVSGVIGLVSFAALMIYGCLK